MKSVGHITKDDIKSFKNCMKVVHAMEHPKFDYNSVGVEGGRVYGTDTHLVVSYPIDLEGKFTIHKKDMDIMCRLGEGELFIDEERNRAKLVAGTRGYVFPLLKEVPQYNIAYGQPAKFGFNMLLGEMKANISFAQDRLRDKPTIILMGVDEKEQVVNMFASNEEKDWFHTIPCKVVGSGVVGVNSDLLLKLAGMLPNKRIKFMAAGGRRSITISNDHVIMPWRLDVEDMKANLLKMANQYPSMKEILNGEEE